MTAPLTPELRARAEQRLAYARTFTNLTDDELLIRDLLAVLDGREHPPGAAQQLAKERDYHADRAENYIGLLGNETRARKAAEAQLQALQQECQALRAEDERWRVHSDEMEAACKRISDLAAIQLQALQQIDNGNTFVFCDHVQRGIGCVRGAGHNGPHAFMKVQQGHNLSPAILADSLTQPGAAQKE